MNKPEDKLAAALTDLSHGAPLIVEDLDLTDLGLYTDNQKNAILQAGGVDDFFVYYIFSDWMWARKNEEGVKWHTYADTGTIGPLK